MTRKPGAWALFLAAGVLISAGALCAEQLGLDRSSGWGRLRIGTLILGIAIAIAAFLYHLNRERVRGIARHVLSPLERQAWVARLRTSNGFIQMSSFLENYWSTFPTMLVVILVYVWLVSSGTWTTWVSPTQHYADLARGFEKGVLYLPVKPDPRLLELPNPYDPAARTNDMGIDVTFYKGRLYLYWGPVPALILVAISPFTHGRVGDLQLVFAFISGIFLLQSLLMHMIWDRFFHALPIWMLHLGILVGGLRTPLTFMLNNFYSARIYEAAITGCQIFFLAGLLIALTLFENRPMAGWKLACIGALWALALGTRLLLAPAIGLMMLAIAYRVAMGSDQPATRIAKLIALGLPVLVGLVALGWYNWARFGSVAETRFYYTLTGVDIQKYYNDVFAAAYVLPNFWNYFMAPFGISPGFPYLHLEYGASQTFLPFLSLSPIYASQFITGLAFAFPFGVFAIIPPATMILDFHRKSRSKGMGSNAGGRSLNWIVFCLSACYLAIIGLLLGYFWAAARFFEDFMPALVVLSAIGFWQGYRSLKRNLDARRAYSAAGIALAGAAILISTLLAISINDLRFGLIALLYSR